MLHMRSDYDDFGAFCQRFLQRFGGSNAKRFGYRAGGQHNTTPSSRVSSDDKRLVAVLRIRSFLHGGIEALAIR